MFPLSFFYASITFSPKEITNAAMHEIDYMLRNNGKTLHDFPYLPLPVGTPNIDTTNHLILQELNYDRPA